jgi:hypothetical protein
MVKQAKRRCEPQRVRGNWLRTAAGVMMTLSILLPAAALADDFVHASYDSSSDELVVTVNYSGTNPQHTFSLQWGACQDVPGSDVHQLAAEVLDSQWQDEARQTFSKTTRFSLDGMPCRPAKLTLRIAPRFITTLMIPAGNHASQ